ncbi:efflux RND transporter permease subunit [Lampropedia aestuarii]|uniref:efflux RND transporter permease subunit n=1 Tax=Lampropedia aestuarii TaxID=2562762 RepID=UPI0031452ED2
MLAMAPQMDLPAIAVRANRARASPESMASTVAAPLACALGAIAVVSKIQPNGSHGFTRIVLIFAFDRGSHEAAREVRASATCNGQRPESATAAWLRKPSRRTRQDVQAQRLLAKMQLMAALGGNGSEPS